MAAINVSSKPYVPAPADVSGVTLSEGGKAAVSVLARLFHEDWRKARLVEGATVLQYPALKRWEDLTEEQKVPNISQAFQAVKLLSQSVDIDGVIAGRVGIDEGAAVNLLARNAHEVWARDKMDAGWRYGPVRDNAAKIHPMLIPYESLPESEKEYDKAVGRQLCRALNELSVRAKENICYYHRMKI